MTILSWSDSQYFELCWIQCIHPQMNLVIISLVTLSNSSRGWLLWSDAHCLKTPPSLNGLNRLHLHSSVISITLKMPTGSEFSYQITLLWRHSLFKWRTCFQDVCMAAGEFFWPFWRRTIGPYKIAESRLPNCMPGGARNCQRLEEIVKYSVSQKWHKLQLRYTSRGYSMIT